MNVDLKNTLKSIVEGEVLQDEKTLSEYSHDASLFEVRPRAVIFPKNSGDIKKLVDFARENKDERISLTARAGGTDMTGGPLSESLVLDFTEHMNSLKEIGGEYAIVEPGMFYRDFEKETLKRNLLLPSFPASKEIAAIGGMVANNAGGEKSLTFGKTDRYVKRLKVVLRDGNEYLMKALSKSEVDEKINGGGFEGGIYKELFSLIDRNYETLQKARPNVSKNSAGYALWDVWDREKQIFDITKLFVGSQGTLGIITEAKFKLIRPKKHASLLVIFLRDFDFIAQVTNKVLTYQPESFESYDDQTLKIAIRFLPDLAKKMGGLWSLLWQFLPEAKMVLTNWLRLPKLVMIAEFTADTALEARKKAQDASQCLKNLPVKHRVTKNEKESQKYWTIRRESFNLLRHHVKGKQTAPFIDDMIVRPEQLPRFLPELYATMSEYDITFTIAGHVGDANFHIIPLMDLASAKDRAIIPELAKKVYRLLFRYGGSMTGEHNDGLIRGSFLKEMYGEEVYALFQKVKALFDPDNIFNPGKKIGASMGYAMSHIRKS